VSPLISIDRIIHAIGFLLALIALITIRDRSNPKRITTALFWALMAGCLIFDRTMVDLWGVRIAHRIVGIVVVLLALVAGLGGVGRGRLISGEAERCAEPRGNILFLPMLAIPIVAVACSLGLKGVSIGGIMLLDKQTSLAALGVAVMVSLALAFWVTRSTVLEAIRESHRLLDALGWAAILPMMLAMLGGIFVAAKTGDSIKLLILMLAPEHQRFVVVALYCAGMAAFTMIMGNAFAAFPVMTAGLALPILVKGMGANPAPLLAMGMYAGYCGTLVTPMAANFNLVPAALLELRDRYGVIRVQVPTATAMFFANFLLMYLLAFSWH